jgi:hypothetical protein
MICTQVFNKRGGTACEARLTGVERLNVGRPVDFCNLHIPRSPGARVQADRGTSSARTTAETIRAEPFLHGTR